MFLIRSREYYSSLCFDLMCLFFYLVLVFGLCEGDNFSVIWRFVRILSSELNQS
jgi:hypothetical protein